MTTLLKTFVAALLLLLLLVGLKFRFEHLFASTTSGIQGELRQPGIDILLVGSSRTRQGYDATQLERATGKKVFVVAYDGLDLESTVPLLKALLESPARKEPARPHLLVVEASWAKLQRPSEIQEPRLFFDAPPHMKLTLLQIYLRTHHGRSAWLDAWTLVANRGSEVILTWPLVHGAVDRLSYHGSYIGKNVAGMPPALFKTLHPSFDPRTVNPEQMTALREIVAIAAAHQVRLVFADPPLPAPEGTMPAELAQRDAFRELAAAEKVPFYEGQDTFAGNDPALFHDQIHLSTAGRALYTQQFALALTQGLQ